MNKNNLSKIMYVWGVLKGERKLDKVSNDFPINNIFVTCEDVLLSWECMEDIQSEEEELFIMVYAKRVILDEFGK